MGEVGPWGGGGGRGRACFKGFTKGFSGMGFIGDFELGINEEKIENKDKWGRIQNQLKKKSYMLTFFNSSKHNYSSHRDT